MLLLLPLLFSCVERSEVYEGGKLLVNVVEMDGLKLTVEFKNTSLAPIRLLKAGSSYGDFQRLVIITDGRSPPRVAKHDQERYSVNVPNEVVIAAGRSYREVVDLSSGWTIDGEINDIKCVCYILLGNQNEFGNWPEYAISPWYYSAKNSIDNKTLTK